MDYTLFLFFAIGCWIIIRIAQVLTTKKDSETFENILNDPRVNSKEVGLKYGIKYFQFMKNEKTGFRDLNGKIVIEPVYDHAEMFSEGYSAVEIDQKWGMIDEKGRMVIEPAYDYLGSMHEGLIYYRVNEKTGFINIFGKIIFEHDLPWVGDFSEGLCVFRNSEDKYGFIDKTGSIALKPVYTLAMAFKNGHARVRLNGQQLTIDKSGNIVPDAPPLHII
jgi:hypothetical protein